MYEEQSEDEAKEHDFRMKTSAHHYNKQPLIGHLAVFKPI
jgi:hypothetical protein